MVEKKAQEPESLNVNEFKPLGTSKRMLYTFLAVDNQVYLPKYEVCTVWFMRQIMNGEKKYLTQEQAHHVFVPHYKGLSVKDFLAVFEQNEHWLDYLPDQDEWHKLPRDFIITVLNGINKNMLKRIVQDKVHERKKQIEGKNELNMKIKPEFKNKLKESQLLDLSKSKSIFQLKETAKKRRTKDQIQADRQAATDKEAEFVAMKRALFEYEKEKELMAQQMHEQQTTINGMTKRLNDHGEPVGDMFMQQK